jgi:hypothetical protein
MPASMAMTVSEERLDSPEAIRDHLGVGIEPEGFDTNGVRFVLCDEANTVLAYVMTDCPADANDEQCTNIVAQFARPLADGPDNAAMLLALTRPGPPALISSDRRWFRAAHAVCAKHKVRLLGVHVVTPHGQREVLLDDALEPYRQERAAGAVVDPSGS